MAKFRVVILLAALSGLAGAQAFIEGVTGERVLLTSGESDLLVGFPEQEYHRRVAPLVGRNIRNLLLMKKKPEALNSGARFGSAFPLEGEIRGVGWILDGNETDGYVLYLDLNVNGDLTDDPPIRFQKEEGAFSRTFGPRNDNASPGLMKLTVVSGPEPSLRIHRLALRRGSIRVGDRDIAFGLIGGLGIYGRVVFDWNGDGKLDTSHASREYYDNAEKYVRVGDTDYEFVIGASGDKLQLKPLPERLPDTQILRPGYPPPDFTFQDLDGKMHRLSDYRGKVVLLDFWMISCGWCQEGIPAMVEAYRKLHPIGVEIIGINGEDAEGPLRAFLAEKNMTWPQTIQYRDDSPIHKSYRVRGFPAYYLIGKDGKLESRRLIGGAEEDLLAEAERIAGER
ncbi:MAG TPA: TlpA disulfide reductase family protein [Bryobacteraceae bacterium]